MTNDWRAIPAKDIAWRDNPISRRAGRHIEHMCSPYWAENGDKHERSWGGWSALTLGAIANLGERYWLRCNSIGQQAVSVIRWVIDEAAEGRCPMTPSSGLPATDAYVPQSERQQERDS